jgi:protein-S-isoprenylcysteine O-methyltransferase Ste14
MTAPRHGLETRVPPPIVALAVAVAMWAVDRIVGRASAAAGARTVVSGGLVALAALVGWIGIRAFARTRTPFDPHRPEKATALVTGGIFRWSRNPMYLSMVLALLGWAAWLGQPWLVLGPVAFVLYITRFQIRPEERALAEKFGAEYESYRRRTRRWI